MESDHIILYGDDFIATNGVCMTLYRTQQLHSDKTINRCEFLSSETKSDKVDRRGPALGEQRGRFGNERSSSDVWTSVAWPNSGLSGVFEYSTGVTPAPEYLAECQRKSERV